MQQNQEAEGQMAVSKAPPQPAVWKYFTRADKDVMEQSFLFVPGSLNRILIVAELPLSNSIFSFGKLTSSLVQSDCLAHLQMNTFYLICLLG